MSKTRCEKCNKKSTVLFANNELKKICKDCKEKEELPVCCKDWGTEVAPKICGAIAVQSFEWDTKITPPHSPGNNTHYRCSTHRKSYPTDAGISTLNDLLSPSTTIVPVEEKEKKFVAPTTIQETIELIIRWCDEIEEKGQKRIPISSVREELLGLLSVVCPDAFDEMEGSIPTKEVWCVGFPPAQSSHYIKEFLVDGRCNTCRSVKMSQGWGGDLELNSRTEKSDDISLARGKIHRG